MTLELYYTSQGRYVIGESSEAKALGYTPAQATPTTTYAGGTITHGQTLSPIPQVNQTGGNVLVGTGTISHPLGATPTDVAVTQGVGGQTTYTSTPTYTPATQNYITSIVGGKTIVLPISSGVASKIAEGGGIQNIMNQQYFSELQSYGQATIDLALRNALYGGADVMRTQSEIAKINAEQNAYQFMLTERATRPEFLAFQTITNPLQQVMKGYAGLGVLLTGGNIDYAKQIELEERKAYVGASLQNPFIPVVDIAMTGVTLFTLTGGNLIQSTNFGKLFQVGLGGYGLYRSAELGVQTYAEAQTKGWNYETGGKMGMTIVGGVVSSTLIYSGWKQPTVWSAPEYAKPTVKFEGESKTLTVGSADFEKNLLQGKSISEVNIKGTEESWWGLRQRFINIKSYPESSFTGKLSEGTGIADVWSPNIVSTKDVLFGRFVTSRSVSYPTSWSETSFLAEPVSFSDSSIKVATGKTFEDYLKGINVMEVRGELPEGVMGRTNVNEKWIKLDVQRMEEAVSSDIRQGTDFAYGYKDVASLKNMILKHEVLHNVYPTEAGSIDVGYTEKTPQIAENYQFGKTGTVSFPSSNQNLIKVFGTTESFTFEGSQVLYGGITGSVSTVNILSTVSKPIKTEAESTTYTTAKGGTVTTLNFGGSDNELMVTATKTFTTTKAFEYNPQSETWSDVGKFTDVGLSFMKAPVISSSTGGGYGQQQIFRPHSSTLGFGGGLANVVFPAIESTLANDLALTTAITSTSMWKNFYPAKTRPYEQEGFTYTYPESNVITQNISNLQTPTVKQTSGTSTTQGLNLGTSFSLGSTSAMTQLQTQTTTQTQEQTQTQLQTQVQLQSQSQLLQQLQIQANAFNFNLNIVPTFAFTFGGGGFAERRKHKKGGKKTNMISIPSGQGSAMSDLLNITVTEAGLLRKGKTPKATVLTGKRATHYFFKSAGLSIPTANQLKIKGLKI